MNNNNNNNIVVVIIVARINSINITFISTQLFYKKNVV